MNQTVKRFWEIDVLRGIAVILMIGFHWIEDQVLLLGLHLHLDPRLLDGWQKITAGLFLLLVGVSLALRRMKSNHSGYPLLWGYVRKGATILLWGAVITLTTRIYLTEGYVVFGVLHLIGLSVILSYPFLKLRYWNLVAGLVVFGVGTWLNRMEFPFTALVWAGFVPQNFYSVDYFPLLPWFGLVLIGIFMGNALYPNYSRKFIMADLGRSPAIKPLSFLGRHSLLIYLAHQPVLVGLIRLFKFLHWL